jgi:hypothetical protein
MLTIEQINAELEQMALQRYDKEYYRGLKNFHLLDSFKLAATDMRLGDFHFQLFDEENNEIPYKLHPIIQYIEENNLKYTTTPYTGYCLFTKIKN